MPAAIASRPNALSSLPSCGSSTITLGFCEMSVESAERWAAASAPAATGLNSTSWNVLAWASALLVMAAIQPWSAAGAEKPMTTFVPGALLPPVSVLPPVLVWVLGSCSLLVHAASRAPAPSAAPPRRNRRRTGSCWVMTTS